MAFKAHSIICCYDSKAGYANRLIFELITFTGSRDHFRSVGTFFKKFIIEVENIFCIELLDRFHWFSNYAKKNKKQIQKWIFIYLWILIDLIWRISIVWLRPPYFISKIVIVFSINSMKSFKSDRLYSLQCAQHIHHSNESRWFCHD